MNLKVGDVLSYRFNSELAGIIIHYNLDRHSCKPFYDVLMFMLDTKRIENFFIYLDEQNVWNKII
jgi:hypothetical protein